MNIAIIKDGICKDSATFGNIETAKAFLERGVWDADSVVELPKGYGIGDSFDGATWTKAESPEVEEESETPISEAETLMLAITELYEGNLALQEEYAATMLAITELYEIMLGD